MVGRLFAQDANLYADIILSDPHNFQMLRRYVQLFDTLLEELEQRGKSDFVQRFADVREYFGEFAQRFLSESQRLLDTAGDAQQIS